MILGLVLASIFLLGPMITPAAALQTNMIEEVFNYGFAPGVNNHTYIYTPPRDSSFLSSFQVLDFSEDTDLTRYNYDNTGWSSPDTTYNEDTSELWNWISSDTIAGGSMGDPLYLPQFYDFVGSDGSGAILNTTLERRSFSLAFGQQTPVAIDSDYRYYGTLAINGQEFVHLTVASLQDGFTWIITVTDPQGRQMVQSSGSDGDIIVLPFRPSIAGTYIVTVQSNAANGERALFEILPQAITPQVIAPGEVITDTLTTGEIAVVGEYDSITHDELVPTTMTYKILPGEDVSSLTYSFNYPIPLYGWFQGATIIFTNDAFTHGVNGGYRYRESISFPENDEYYCRGEAHYITVMGGDNIDYTLYHEADVAAELVVNQEFRVDNLFGHAITNVYSLIVPEDSVLKLNTTSTSDFEQSLWTILDSGYRQYYSIDDGTSLTTSPIYYLPAGDYVVVVDVESYVSEWMEFTFQPMTTSSSAAITNIGGFIVSTEPCHEYNLTITLDNLYNVSVPMDVHIYNNFYSSIVAPSFVLGTWFDGSSQIPHSTYESSRVEDINTRVWTEGYALIVISTYPYNNTAGIGDYYENFPVDLRISWDDVTHDNYVAAASIDASTTPNHYNFTFDTTGDSVELYSLLLNTSIGTWYNVSITSNEVNSFSAFSYVHYQDRTHYTGTGDLNDALQGSAPDWSFQFGGITDAVYLEFSINRNLADGHFSVEVIPMDTYMFEYPTELGPTGPDILAILGSIALPLGVGVVAIVIVVVVYFKKFKK
jgi:hypothetical protein